MGHLSKPGIRSTKCRMEADLGDLGAVGEGEWEGILGG